MNHRLPDTQMAFSRALNLLLDRRGLPTSNRGRLQAFADLTKRPVSTAHRWLTGGGIPDVNDLYRLCGILSCSIYELLGRVPLDGQQRHLDPMTHVTYFLEDGEEVASMPSSFFGAHDADRPIGGIRISGPEMRGYVEPADRVFFDMRETDIRSGGVFALRIRAALALRRLRFRHDGKVDVLCDNPLFPAETLPREYFKRADQAGKDDIIVLGRVIAKLNLERR